MKNIQIQIEWYNHKNGVRWVLFIYNNISSKYNKRIGFKKWKLDRFCKINLIQIFFRAEIGKFKKVVII